MFYQALQNDLNCERARSDFGVKYTDARARMVAMTLAMTWQEWVQHDAVGLAECVRRGDVSPTELAQQAATGVALIY